MTRRKPNKVDSDPLKEATIIALKRVIDPLLSLMFDAGVTVQDLNQLIRERAVRSASERLLRESGQESKSRVAIVTGLPRSEVARILDAPDAYPLGRRGQHPARRVLDAWHKDPRFLTKGGDPALLPVYGSRRSFEKLISLYSVGTPVRAMLDELTRIDAVEICDDQHVRAKSRVPIFTGLTTNAIAMVGERGRDLLETLTNNMRRSSNPLFEATAVVSDAEPEMVSLIRREITQQGTNFINGVDSLLSRSQKKPTGRGVDSNGKRRLGVTVFYFQDTENAKVIPAGLRAVRRKNLKRTTDAKLTSRKRKSNGSNKDKPPLL